MTLTLILCGVGATLVSARQQPAGPPALQATGTGLIAGQIVDARGAGVAGAVVTLNGGLQQIALTTQATSLPGGPKTTITNGDGQFVFFDLAAGAYSIDVTKPGFLPGAFGRRRFGGPAQSLELAGGERKGQVRIPIWEYAAITGRVLDESGEPAVGVQVRALNLVLAGGSRRWTPGAIATTDDRGWYRLDAIEPGESLVVVASTQITLPAAVMTSLAAQSAGSSNLVPLMRNLPIGGVSPTGSTSVGEWAWLSNSRSSAVVPSTPGGGPAFVYPTTFHPNARSTAEAASITVGSGEERSDINIHLQPAAATTVRGTVSGPDGPVGGLPIRLLANFADSLNVDALEAAASVTDAAGRFTFVGVPVGPYMLRAAASPGSAVGVSESSAFTGLWALQPVVVTSAGPSDVAVTLRPGVTLRGRLELRGTSPKPGPEIVAKLFARLEALDPYTPRSQSAYQVNFTRDGEFVFTNVPPGRYVVGYAAFVPERLAMPQWETLGAELDGKDVSYRPFTITSDLSDILVVLTDRPTELSGMVRGASGQGDPNAAVLLFTAERDLWTNPAGFTRRMRMMRASETGSYLIRGIPSGDYFLATIPEDDAGNWQDPSVLDRLSRGALRIVIAPGDKKTQDLRSVR